MDEGGQIWLKCIEGDLIMMMRYEDKIFERVKKNHADLMFRLERHFVWPKHIFNHPKFGLMLFQISRGNCCLVTINFTLLLDHDKQVLLTVKQTLNKYPIYWLQLQNKHIWMKTTFARSYKNPFEAEAYNGLLLISLFYRSPIKVYCFNDHVRPATV